MILTDFGLFKVCYPPIEGILFECFFPPLCLVLTASRLVSCSWDESGGSQSFLTNLLTSLFLIRCTDLIEIVVASWLWGGHKQVPEYCIPSSERKLLEHQVMFVFFTRLSFSCFF